MPTTLVQAKVRPGLHSHPARLVLPVAPHVNARSRFAPAVKTTPAMLPTEAIAWLDRTLVEGVAINTVEIFGPGDPLATPESTMEALRLLRRRHPDLKLLVCTLGLYGDLYAQALAENGVSQITVLVDAVDLDIVSNLYAWIRPGKRTVPLAKAAEILLSEQATAIAAFKRVGMAVTIRTTVYPGVNDGHIEEIARLVASLGAEMMTIIPCLPGGVEQESLPVPDKKLMQSLRGLAAKHITIVDVPEADGSGKLSQATTAFDESCLAAMIPKPSRERPNVAVVSSNGMDVDLHLGQAHRVMIYGPREDGLPCLLKTRLVPEAGGGGSRWERLSEILSDCFVLLAASAGDNPRTILRDRGIGVLITDGNIEGTVDVLYGGGKKSKCRDQRPIKA